MTWSTLRGIPCAALLIAALQIPDDGAAQEVRPDRLVDMNLIVDGESFASLLADRERLEAVLREVGGPELPDRFAQGEGGVFFQSTETEGIGGAFLDTALGQILSLDIDLRSAIDDGVAVVDTFSAGQILGWDFKPAAETGEGAQRGSGTIEVLTVQYVIATPSPDAPDVETTVSATALKWTIGVEDDGFVVETRATPFTDFINQPFPQSATPISQGGANVVLPTKTIVRANFRQFDTKIWAAGDDIEVLALARSQNWPTDPFEEVDPVNFPGYFTPSPDSCIDLMLALDGGDVPTTTSELVQPGHYCLGRCESPNIVNTP